MCIRTVACALSAALLAACSSGSQDPSWTASYLAASISYRDRNPDRIQLAQEGYQGCPEEAASICGPHFRLLLADNYLADRDPVQALTYLQPPLPAGAPQHLELRRKLLLLSQLDPLPEESGGPGSLDQIRDEASRQGFEEVVLEVAMGQTGGLPSWTRKLQSLEPIVRDFATSDSEDPFGNLSYQRFRLFNNLCFYSNKASRNEAAVEYCRQALRATQGAQMKRIDGILLNLAEAYNRLGHTEKALESAEKAAAVSRERKDDCKLQNALGEAGNSYAYQESFEEAAAQFRRAVEAGRSCAGSAGAADSGLWMRNLARVLIELRRWKEAREVNTAAQPLTPPSSLVYLEFNRAAIDLGLGHLEEAQKGLQALLYRIENEPDLPPGLAWQVHAELAELWSARNRRDRAEGHYERALGEIEANVGELTDPGNQISYLERLNTVFRGYVYHLLSDEQPWKALQVVERGKGLVLAIRLRDKGISDSALEGGDLLKRLQGSAEGPDFFYLSYWLGQESLHSWLITPRDKYYFPSNVGQGQFDKWVEEYLADLKALEDRPRGARELADNLLGPLEGLVPADSLVVLSLYGSLNGLPFDALPLPNDLAEDEGPYWANRVFFARTPTLGLAPRGSKWVLPQTALLIGDVDYGGEYPPLPFAAEEVRQVASVLRSAHLRIEIPTGGNSTPSLLLRRQEAAKGPEIAHISAHAIASGDNPLESALILSPDPVSGDRKLLARQLGDQRLPYRLVVLSACRSAGIKAYSGEGQVGLAWTFLQSGADEVVASLWEANDKATAHLMASFYRSLVSGQAPPRALGEAKREFLRSNPLPYLWAPFQTYLR